MKIIKLEFPIMLVPNIFLCSLLLLNFCLCVYLFFSLQLEGQVSSYVRYEVCDDLLFELVSSTYLQCILKNYTVESEST